jgi:hypothetical protein
MNRLVNCCCFVISFFRHFVFRTGLNGGPLLGTLIDSNHRNSEISEDQRLLVFWSSVASVGGTR